MHQAFSRQRSEMFAQRRQNFCVAEAGKGFGTVKPPRQSPKKKQKVTITDNGSDAVRKAVNLAEGPNSGPIDPKQASRGKIDYAKVKNWGSDRQKDPGSLQLESFISGEPQNMENMSFYVRLTTKIIRDKESGLLDDIIFNRLPVPVKKDMPAPEKWVFTKQRYVQYLVDLQAVHHEIESAVAEAFAVASDGSPIQKALYCFSQSTGLDRSLEIATDLNNLDHSTSSAEHPGPSLHILAYTKYLRQLATKPDGRDSSEDVGLRIIAHAYALHLNHLTNGSKIGASIAEQLNLFRLNAVHLYRSYPQKDSFPNKDPFKAFSAQVNACGNALSEEQRKVVESEVPLATGHNMQLLEPLAHAD